MIWVWNMPKQKSVWQPACWGGGGGSLGNGIEISKKSLGCCSSNAASLVSHPLMWAMEEAGMMSFLWNEGTSWEAKKGRSR